MKKIIPLTMLGIVLIFNFSFARDFIIAGIPEEPNRWVDVDGNYRGIDIDIIDYIMNKMGIKYKIILEDSSMRLKKKWEMNEPEYDMVFTYSKKKEREEKLYYAKESHIFFSWNLFYRKKDEGKYKFETFEDLKGLKIGMTKGFSYTAEFWEAAEKGLFEKDIVVRNKLQIKKLLGGRFDLVPLNTQVTLYEAKENNFLNLIGYLKKPIKSKPYYNTFVKASDYPDLDKIREYYDIILKEMKEDGTLDEMLAKYGLKYE